MKWIDFWKDYNYELHFNLTQYRRDILSSIVEKNNLTSVYEIGCGNGQILDAMYQKDPAPTYSGSDYNQDVILEGQKKYPHLNLCCLDAHHQNLPHVDLIFTCGTLIFFPPYTNKMLLKKFVNRAKFIVHIELNGKSGVYQRGKNGNPTLYSFDYAKQYETAYVKELKRANSSANWLIVKNCTEEQLIL